MHPKLLDPDLCLPGAADLPCSDDTPVDNENQHILPDWLRGTLAEIWQERQDWFFGMDMAIYNREGQRRRTPTVIPDGFLSLGVERHKRGALGRLSYVLQEENEIAPLFALEMVSKTYGKEYDEKLHKYEQLGVKYYVIYNREYSNRDGHHPFEVYKLVNQSYQLQQREPYWMPEIGLGIGRVQGQMEGIDQEWLVWHDRSGNPYPVPMQVIQRERQRANQERQRANQERQRANQERQRAEQVEQARLQERQRAQQLEDALQQEQQRAEQAQRENLKLLEKLQQLGIDPDQL